MKQPKSLQVLDALLKSSLKIQKSSTTLISAQFIILRALSNKAKPKLFSRLHLSSTISLFLFPNLKISEQWSIKKQERSLCHLTFLISQNGLKIKSSWFNFSHNLISRPFRFSLRLKSLIKKTFAWNLTLFRFV